MRLNRKVVIIVGGVSGIGAEVSRAFVSNGAKIMMVDSKEKEGNILVKELGASARFVKEDLSSADFSSKVRDRVLEEYGCLDVLVNVVENYAFTAEKYKADKVGFNSSFSLLLNLSDKCCDLLADTKGAIINLIAYRSYNESANKRKLVFQTQAVLSFNRIMTSSTVYRNVRLNNIFASQPSICTAPAKESTHSPSEISFGGHRCDMTDPVALAAALASENFEIMETELNNEDACMQLAGSKLHQN